ncbi:hypothetical protein ACLMJK_005647 [Lecanora helva]
MKFTHQTFALLALTTPLTVLAAPADPPFQSSADIDASSEINHSKLLSDQLSETLPVDPSLRAASSSNCISVTFSSSNPNWNYFFNGDWGLGTGKVSSLGTRTLCGSGAMFVGSQSKGNGLGSAAGGNTKLECTVKGGVKQDSVCNISLVDGYSQSMHCTGTGFGDIGGTRNLFDLGSCPKVNGNGHTCVNTGGHSNTAKQFFKNGGRYWYQDNVDVKTNFGGNPKVHCAIHP